MDSVKPFAVPKDKNLLRIYAAIQQFVLTHCQHELFKLFDISELSIIDRLHSFCRNCLTFRPQQLILVRSRSHPIDQDIGRFRHKPASSEFDSPWTGTWTSCLVPVSLANRHWRDARITTTRCCIVAYLQSISSSPWGHCRLPSHLSSTGIHSSLLLQWKRPCPQTVTNL